MAFREIAGKPWTVPERFMDQRYTSVMRGVGMHGATPFIAHAMENDDAMAFRPGMVMRVESCIGKKCSREGVKLEDKILITNAGTDLLSRFPSEDAVLDAAA